MVNLGNGFYFVTDEKDFYKTIRFIKDEQFIGAEIDFKVPSPEKYPVLISFFLDHLNDKVDYNCLYEDMIHG